MRIPSPEPATDLPLASLTELCASVRDLFDAKACVCAVVDDTEGCLEFVAVSGALPALAVVAAELAALIA